MCYNRISIHGVVVCLCILCFLQSGVRGDSIYAIPSHGERLLYAYSILEDPYGQLEYRDRYHITLAAPVDVTVDKDCDMLFVTSEGSNEIELVDARTFLSKGTVVAAAAFNLAGIVLDYIDPNTTRLYTVDRGYSHLFVYDWDAAGRDLTLIKPDPNDPANPKYGEETDYFLLDANDVNCTGAFGLALDDVNNRLYVTYNNSTVHYFDTRSDYFDHLGKLELDRSAMDIDIDTTNNYLYTGGYLSHNYLVKTWLGDPNDPNTAGEVDIGAGVIGLAVDRQSGYVYCTTYNYLLEAWNPDGPFGLGWILIDAEPITAGGGGVCIADVDYVPPFSVDKIADVNDVVGCTTPRPGEEITYTISYDYNWTEPGDPNLYAFSSIHIEDFLPKEVDFVSADPDTGFYDDETHSYIWIITPENFGSPNSLEITVELNKKVTPGEPIENTVVEIVSAIAGQTYKQTAEVQTTICECADNGKIIYVDKTATQGNNNGTSWTDAYVYLQSALKVAFPCDQVWVAEGTYIPENEPNDIATFRLVNAVGLYGGFDGTETEVYERDWFNNETTLSGYIDPNEVNFVITADDDIRWAILDGFTITRGLWAGVYFQGGSVLLEHNFITDNGIGVYCNETQSPKIRNNWIYENTIGMSFEDLQDIAVVRNNTVVDNDPMGVSCDSDIEPSIKNCIFRGHADANDLIGCYAAYSCIEYPTEFYEDPNETIYLGIGEGNIDDDPLFEAGDYHLSSTSPCIDLGDPNETCYHQRDIDKQFRVLYERVDMGADEYYDCDYDLAADFNEDGIVNFPDFGEFAEHWLNTVSDQNWDNLYDLAGDDEAIDVNDLALFADEWLWMDCETMISFPMEEQRGIDDTYEMMMMKSSGSSAYGLQAVQAEPALKEQIDNAQEIIDFLERLWKNDKDLRKTIDKKDWDEFIDKVYEWFYALEDLYAEK